MHPFHFREGHLFIEIEGALWLLDTGAPTSFGSVSEISLEGEVFQPASDFMGLDMATLSQLLNVECAGLLATDILGRFDFVFDPENDRVEISTEDLEFSGQSIPLVDNVRGIPIVLVSINGAEYRMFFDTGAQISYFQHDSLAGCPSAGEITDFYPGVGEFQTETYHVDLALGELDFTLRCGVLPELLGAALLGAGTDGIIGNEVLRNRRIGYFPRRRMLVL